MNRNYSEQIEALGVENVITMNLENKREKDRGVHFPSYGMDEVGMGWYT